MAQHHDAGWQGFDAEGLKSTVRTAVPPTKTFEHADINTFADKIV